MCGFFGNFFRGLDDIKAPGSHSFWVVFCGFFFLGAGVREGICLILKRLAHTSQYPVRRFLL